MTKTYKEVLKSSLIMLILFAVAGSGVAQAQECFARRSTGSPNAVRAEGMTELLGGIELLCMGGMGTGFDPPATAEISIELNTMITNAAINDVVQGLTYTDTDGMALDSSSDAGLGEESDWNTAALAEDAGGPVQVLSDDGMEITWAIPSMELALDTRTGEGGTVVIRGILADAFAVGNGEDITATVMVNGLEATGSPIKLADVTTGLVIEVTAASGLQCEAGKAVATIMFTEGFNSAITAVAEVASTTDVMESARNSVLVLNFRGVPDGVTATASLTGTGMAMEEDMTDLAPLMLMTGDTEGADEDGIVSLSSAGVGEVMYTFDTGFLVDPDEEGVGAAMAGIRHIDDGKKEWNNVEITFTWAAGEPPLDMGTITVSYDPVSTDTSNIPRYVSGPTNDVIEINDCTTTLLFPYVTNTYSYDTGLVITNASDGSGSCTIGYSSSDGFDAPDDMRPPDIEGGEQWIGLLSTIAAGFQGYITANCEFRDAHGFAFITNGEATLAQGYLAVCTNCD